MKELLNKTILEYKLNSDCTIIEFKCEDGIYSYSTEADCCNKVWFYGINPPYQFPCKVTEVKSDTDGEYSCLMFENIFTDEEEYDVLDCAFIHLETNEGVFTIEIRNNHNGYYGGRVVFVGRVDK
jgi:hypothetical protein